MTRPTNDPYGYLFDNDYTGYGMSADDMPDDFDHSKLSDDEKAEYEAYVKSLNEPMLVPCPKCVDFAEDESTWPLREVVKTILVNRADPTAAAQLECGHVVI